MTKSLSTIKKFQFFDVEKFEADPNQNKQIQSVDYNLNNITPVQFRVYNKLYFICGQVKRDNSTSFRFVKIHPCGKIIDEYIPFSDSIIDFDIKDLDGKTFLIIVGTDLKNPETEKSVAKAEMKQGGQFSKESSTVKVSPTENSIPSIKIFDFSKFIEKTNCEINEWKGPTKDQEEIKNRLKILEGMLVPLITIYLMRKKNNENEFYQGNTITGLEEYSPMQNISYFSISPRINHIAFSLEGDTLYEIKTDDNFNFFNAKERRYNAIKSADTKNITNIKHIIINNLLFLFFTTEENTYFKQGEALKANLISEQNMQTGTEEKNFDVSSDNRILITNTSLSCLDEYSYFENEKKYNKIRTKVFEKPTKFVQIFKKYHVFVLYEETLCTLCVYDPDNHIFISYNSGLNNILSVIADNNKVYILSDNMGIKKIVCFKEKDNKDKFDTFYKKNFFETAFNYAKNLNYDKKKLSEISKLHAEHLYKKAEYEKSIEQYKLTINYLDPSYVIQKFLDGSKLNFLIDYLEALQNNEEFKSKCVPERLKDFTALLLNCYIKQKQIKKLKDFVESKNINDDVTIKTAIEVCKDTNKIDLALSIAQKAKMVESYIQILMDIKGDFAESLDFIKQLSDIEQKFNLLLKYGEKFIEKKEVIEDSMKLITSIVNDIISIRNLDENSIKDDEEKKKIKQIKYEKIISIFITKESEAKLEELLDNIMNRDKDCPKQIILRRIELYVDKYAETKNSSQIVEKIREILVNEKFKNKLDKNYLLMLFKISGFNQGVTELSKIMELDQDLLQIYMETHEYEKINKSCEAIMNKYVGSDKKVNYWLQALNYYISISTQSTKGYLGKYIIEVLDHLSNAQEEENFSPMILLDILDKARSNYGHIVEFKVIKKYIIDWIKKQQESLKNDKKETESNYKSIENNNQQIKELQIKAKPFNLSKCLICGQPLDIPFVYFTCGHGFHQLCISGESYEEFECSTCKAKNSLLLNKIEVGKKLAEDPQKFFSDIKGENNHNVKKFDVFAEYLGKGIFINKNEEPEKKIEQTSYNF